jgi:hypothetical protein
MSSAEIEAIITGGAELMEKETASARKSDPIIIGQPGMRMTIAHRQGVGGSDEGLTFDITTAGPEREGKRILRFDCFTKTRNITSVPPANIRFTT